MTQEHNVFFGPATLFCGELKEMPCVRQRQEFHPTWHFELLDRGLDPTLGTAFSEGCRQIGECPEESKRNDKRFRKHDL